MSQFERITADDVHVGDWIARAKTHPFYEVRMMEGGPVAVYIYFDGHNRIRPRWSTKLWRRKAAS